MKGLREELESEGIMERYKFVAADGTLCETEEEMERINRKVEWIFALEKLRFLKRDYEYMMYISIPRINDRILELELKMRELESEGV